MKAELAAISGIAGFDRAVVCEPSMSPVSWPQWANGVCCARRGTQLDCSSKTGLCGRGRGHYRRRRYLLRCVDCGDEPRRGYRARALRMASAAAALACTRPGAQSSIPTAAEVQAFLRKAAR